MHAYFVCPFQEEEAEWGVVSSLYGEDALRGAITTTITAAAAVPATTTTIIITASLHLPSGCQAM